MLALVKLIALIIGLTLLSGFADAQGFLHAAQIWVDRKVIWLEVAKSALGFGSGIILYWIALKYLKEAQIAAPEIQTLIWFGVTIVGVAIASGKFAHWRGTEQLVATGVLLGISWLLVRTSG
jgi:hypothetical protein